jgi:hypothetical protein
VLVGGRDYIDKTKGKAIVGKQNAQKQQEARTPKQTKADNYERNICEQEHPE